MAGLSAEKLELCLETYNELDVLIDLRAQLTPTNTDTSAVIKTIKTIKLKLKVLHDIYANAESLSLDDILNHLEEIFQLKTKIQEQKPVTSASMYGYGSGGAYGQGAHWTGAYGYGHLGGSYGGPAQLTGPRSGGLVGTFDAAIDPVIDLIDKRGLVKTGVDSLGVLDTLTQVQQRLRLEKLGAFIASRFETYYSLCVADQEVSRTPKCIEHRGCRG